jgi:hypothetical protein
MPIRVDVFTAGGTASGVAPGAAHLRDLLEGRTELALLDASWRPIDSTRAEVVGDLKLAVDDILVAIGDDDPMTPVHASWHEIELAMGPYVVSGELPTLPGYDPGRALTRPTGEFVTLRDVRMGWLNGTGGTAPVSGLAHINRYGVDRVRADLMLGFYFPGAALETPDATPA